MARARASTAAAPAREFGRDVRARFANHRNPIGTAATAAKSSVPSSSPSTPDLRLKKFSSASTPAATPPPKYRGRRDASASRRGRARRDPSGSRTSCSTKGRRNRARPRGINRGGASPRTSPRRKGRANDDETEDAAEWGCRPKRGPGCPVGGARGGRHRGVESLAAEIALRRVREQTLGDVLVLVRVLAGGGERTPRGCALGGNFGSFDDAPSTPLFAVVAATGSDSDGRLDSDSDASAARTSTTATRAGVRGGGAYADDAGVIGRGVSELRARGPRERFGDEAERRGGAGGEDDDVLADGGVEMLEGGVPARPPPRPRWSRRRRGSCAGCQGAWR